MIDRGQNVHYHGHFLKFNMILTDFLRVMIIKKLLTYQKSCFITVFLVRKKRLIKYLNAFSFKFFIIDYHQHAEYIVNTLKFCAQCCLKLDDNAHTIQYATEALQYNRNEDDTLIYCAEAFENENL